MLSTLGVYLFGRFPRPERKRQGKGLLLAACPSKTIYVKHTRTIGKVTPTLFVYNDHVNFKPLASEVTRTGC